MQVQIDLKGPDVLQIEGNPFGLATICLWPDGSKPAQSNPLVPDMSAAIASLAWEKEGMKSWLVPGTTAVFTHFEYANRKIKVVKFQLIYTAHFHSVIW